MDVCGADHDDVAFDASIGCPVCDLRDDKQGEIDDMARRIDDLTDERDDFEQQLAEANEKLERYKLLEDKIGGMIHDRL